MCVYCNGWAIEHEVYCYFAITGTINAHLMVMVMYAIFGIECGRWQYINFLIFFFRVLFFVCVIYNIVISSMRQCTLRARFLCFTPWSISINGNCKNRWRIHLWPGKMNDFQMFKDSMFQWHYHRLCSFTISSVFLFFRFHHSITQYLMTIIEPKTTATTTESR